MNNVERFPVRGPQRIATLKAALYPIDTSTMSTPSVVDLCEAALPGCTIDEIIQALKECAEEHYAEADALRASRDP